MSNRNHAETAAHSGGAGAAAEVPRNDVFCGDCVAGMAAMPPDSVDLIVTDPPFAIDFKAARANYNRTDGRVLEGYNEIPAAEYADFSRAWMREAFRLLRPAGSAFVFSGWNNLKDILVAADECGFVTVNHIIWKYQFGVFCRRRFVTSHYHCLFLCKDDRRRKFNPHCRFAPDARRENGGSSLYADMEDVWVIKREYWPGDKKTPTKLPAELVEKILAYASDPGDLVLDPFMGSGQVAMVSKMAGRDYVGFEIVPEYHAFVRERLESGQYRIRADEGEGEKAPALIG